MTDQPARPAASPSESGGPPGDAETVVLIQDRPGVIHARPVRHPRRWVGAAVIGILVAMMVSSFVTNPRWDWALAGEVMIQRPVLNGLLMGTLFGTVASMLIGVALGTAIAVSRLSTNPVLRLRRRSSTHGSSGRFHATCCSP